MPLMAKLLPKGFWYLKKKGVPKGWPKGLEPYILNILWEKVFPPTPHLWEFHGKYVNPWNAHPLMSDFKRIREPTRNKITPIWSRGWHRLGKRIPSITKSIIGYSRTPYSYNDTHHGDWESIFGCEVWPSDIGMVVMDETKPPLNMNGYYVVTNAEVPMVDVLYGGKEYPWRIF